MDESEDWYADYDSAFLRHPPSLPAQLLHNLQLSSPKLTIWPHLPSLPQLPHLFQILEEFLLDQRNWSATQCEDHELQQIEQSLSNLTLLLQIEKQYGQQFWREGNRRIQSSASRLLSLLNLLTVSLLPEDCFTLVQANSTEKLVTEILKLQNLVNHLLPLLRPIHEFMFRSQFGEEKQLTKEFFRQLNEFMQNLPRLNKSALHKVPRLVEYVCLCNELEVEERKLKITSKQTIPRQPSRKIMDSSKKERKQYEKKESYQFFKFNEHMRRETAYYKRKKLTITTNDTKTKYGSQEKDNSSLDKSLTLTMIDPIKLKSQTLASNPLNASTPRSRVRQRGATTNEGEFRTSRSLRRRRTTLTQEQLQQQRDTKTKKKKPVKLEIKLSSYSQLLNPTTGQVRGWALIRHYVQKKIAERKLRKLLLF